MGRQRNLANREAQQVPAQATAEAAPVEKPKFAIKWKVNPEPVEIELDRDAFSYEDMLDFTDLKDKFDNKQITERQLMEALGDMLSRLSGLDCRKLPSWQVLEMIQALSDLVGASDVKN